MKLASYDLLYYFLTNGKYSRGETIVDAGIQTHYYMCINVYDLGWAVMQCDEGLSFRKIAFCYIADKVLLVVIQHSD